MVSGEASPAMKLPVSSDQSLSKTHISPTSHNFRSKPSSSKIGRNRSKNITGRCSLTSVNLHAAAYGMNDHSSNSPYYKGLTDQSLAIVEGMGSHSHTLSPGYGISITSPYYRGLTDYSLVIGSWNHPDPNHNPIPPNNNNNNSLSHECSPYYRGLTDYSLALHQPPIMKNKTDYFTLKELKMDADVDLLLQEKPLRVANAHEMENESEAIKVDALEEMELVTNNDDDVDMVIEEKPLRERVSEKSDVEEEEMTLPVSVSVSVSEQTELLYSYTWATKHQPMFLADFICNTDKALQLKAMVKEGGGCKHFIFEGPPCVGKRSMIRAMLREVFGVDKVQIIEECKEFNLKGEMVEKLQVRLKKSLHHVEVNLSETKGYEKHVTVELFKETYATMINNSLPCTSENCQAIILYEAEKLSMESLLYIKWLLEKYKGCNKVFFCCSDDSKLQPVKPLCTTLRLSSPSSQEIVKILENIGKEEGVKLSPDLVNKIVLRSKNNLRQAIRSLEATCRNKDVLKDDDLILTGWEDDILDIANKITEEQSPRQLYIIRRKLQSLVIHDVPPDFVYKSLVAELTSLVDESLRSGVAKLDKEFNGAREIKFETMKQLGHAQNKQLESDEKKNESTKKNAFTYLKVEEFIAKFMSWYKISSEKRQ